MQIYRLNQNNTPAVARLMSELNPVFWDYSGVLEQLGGVENTIGTVGWFVGDSEANPKGWVLCRELWSYRSIELECCGYDDGGIFSAEHKLNTLFDEICRYAVDKGFVSFRTAMGSQQFSIHGRELGDIANEISNLTPDGRIDYDWLIRYGFRVVGIQPNAYGDKFHCILLSKDLRGYTQEVTS